MCGRFNLTATPEVISEHFHLQRLPRFQPSYNITPAQKVLSIVKLEDKSLKAVNIFWGLVPSWAKDTKNSHHLINARAETVREKPSFRAAFHKRRCLIVATGFIGRNLKTTNKLFISIAKITSYLLLPVFGSIGNMIKKPSIPAPLSPPVPLILCSPFTNGSRSS